MAMITSLSGHEEATFRAIQSSGEWWLWIVKGDNRVSMPLSPHEWVALRDACYAPSCEVDQGFQALADRDPTPPADADNVGGPMPRTRGEDDGRILDRLRQAQPLTSSASDGAPLEIDEGDYLSNVDPLRLPD